MQAFLTILVLSSAVKPALALSQTNSPAEPTPAAQPPAKSSPDKRASGPEGLYLEGLIQAPFSRARLSRALTIITFARNNSPQPRTVVAVGKVTAAPDFHAAARVVIPPFQQRSIELRMRVPENIKQESIEVNVSLNDPDNPNQVLLSPQNTPLIDHLQLSINTDWIVTGVVMKPPPPIEPDWYWPRSDLEMEYEWMVATRADSLHTRRTLTIDHANLPTQFADWQGIDQIVITHERPFHDVAVVESLKRWIASGGRAWIMIDQIPPALLRQLLSDGMSCEWLDDIELNKFVIESTAVSRLNSADRTVESDQPLHFRRVTQTGGEVTLAIDDYPVAIWYRIGKGTVLITTLAPEAWVVPRTSLRKQSDDFATAFQLRPWAMAMADRLHEFKKINSPIEAADIQYPLQQIGNPVLDRSYVLAIVFGFCGLISTVAGLCWLTNRMLQLAWLIPVLSALATLPLLISSANQRREIPDTSAHLQLIEVQPGSQNIQALQWTASYMSQADNAKLLSNSDATVSWPHSADQLDLRRWTWLDYDKWELSSSGWPHGLWQMQTRYVMPKKNLDVRAGIDEKGLHLQLPQELKLPLADSVLQIWPGNPAPCGLLKGTETIRSPERLLAQNDSWLTESIVSDEQRRREQVYKQLHATGSVVGYPSYPALMGWTQLWPGPLSWNEERDERGSALVVLPIKLLHTPSGQRVHVPSTVVHVHNTDRSGTTSTAFSNSSGWWRDATTLPAKASMRCTLPQQVCPLLADEMTCHLQVRAPQRKFTLRAMLPDGHTKLVQEFISPTATQTIRIIDPELLEDLRDGIIDFEIEISAEISETETVLGDQQAIWQIDYFRLSADGQVGPR